MPLSVHRLLLQASVSLVDVRTGQSVMQLKGHTDNIRCAFVARLWRICPAFVAHLCACVLSTLVAAVWRCAAAQEACTHVHMPACLQKSSTACSFMFTVF